MNKKQHNQEFLDNRTSWKFFQRKIDWGGTLENGSFHVFIVLLLLEVLKELQYMNDNKKP